MDAAVGVAVGGTGVEVSSPQPTSNKMNAAGRKNDVVSLRFISFTPQSYPIPHGTPSLKPSPATPHNPASGDSIAQEGKKRRGA